MNASTLAGGFVLLAQLSTVPVPIPGRADPAAEEGPRPAATSSSAVTTGEVDGLRELVRQALQRNPEVQRARAMTVAKRARISQAGSLPDPMLMYGVINEGRPVPFETLGEADFSEVYVGISQEIPYAGKRPLRESVAREEASAEEWAYQGVRRRVIAEVAESYYDLHPIDAALEVLERNVTLFEQVLRVARSRYAVGAAAQQDVLDAEVERSLLEERRSMLAQRRAIVEANLGRLLFTTGEAPRVDPVVIDTPLDAGLEDLLARADRESPRVRELERLVAQGEAKLDLARRERLPDLGANFVYHNRGGLDPYYSFGGVLTLPIYAGRKQKKAVEEAAADLDSGRSALDAARAQARYDVTEAYGTATTTERLLRLYDDGILKQARLSLDSATSQYQVGKIDFLTLTTSWRRLLDYDLTYHEQLVEHAKALARLSVHVDVLPYSGFARDLP